MKLLVCLLALGMGLSQPSAAYQPDHIEASLVRIEANPGGGWITVGTGALVRARTYKSHHGVLTAQHVADFSEIADMRACFTTTQDDCVGLGSFISGPVITEAEVPGDWALFPLRTKPGHPALRLSWTPVLVGDTIATMGYPWGVLKYARGYVNSPPDSSGLYRLHLAIGPGYSGAPVVDRRGRVICVISAYTTVPYPGLEGIPFPSFDQAQCAVPDLGFTQQTVDQQGH